MVSLEVCCFNSVSALNARSAGATRIELCGDVFEGGSTPNHDSFFQLRFVGKMTLPIFVMIRPRGGDFHYTSAEFSQMKIDIHKFKNNQSSAKADGFVFGILDEKNRVDVERNKELVDLARPLPCTFHRAFDEIPEEHMDQALEDVITCGFSNILTSGGQKTAMDGAETLKHLVGKASGRINIMPGGGVRSENIGLLVKETGAKWFHSSALVNGERVATGKEIKKMLDALQT